MTGRSKKQVKTAHDEDEEAKGKARAIEWLKTFDGVVWHFKDDYRAILEINDAPSGPNAEYPEGLAYCFTFHEPGGNGREGNRIYGLDNAHSPDKSPPFDHEHKTTWPKGPPGARPRDSKPTRYAEASIHKALEKFPLEIAKIMEKLGLSQDAVGESRLPPRKQTTEQLEEVGEQTAAVKKTSKGAKK